MRDRPPRCRGWIVNSDIFALQCVRRAPHRGEHHAKSQGVDYWWPGAIEGRSLTWRTGRRMI